MGAVGGVEVIPESLMNAAGAISGSGPAYVSLKYIMVMYLKFFEIKCMFNYLGIPHH